MTRRLWTSDLRQVGIYSAIDVGFYRRSTLRGERFPFIAQVFELGDFNTRMRVAVARDVMDLDFSRFSTRLDLPGTYVRRPGLYLSELLDSLNKSTYPALSLNGNNIGYWGNQYAILNSRLVEKRVPSVFFDDRENRSGTYSFVGWTEQSGYQVDDYYLDSRVDERTGRHDYFALKLHSSQMLMSVGVSGLPIVRESRLVWMDNLTQAWDPNLLYPVGKLDGAHPSQIRSQIEANFVDRRRLNKLAMTVLGVSSTHRLSGIVFEKSVRSEGVTIEDAARFAESLGFTDALVLGASGDAQIGSTDEGVLAIPAVSRHDVDALRYVERSKLSRGLRGYTVSERPIPSAIIITPSRSDAASAI